MLQNASNLFYFVKIAMNKKAKNYKLLSVTEFIFCNNPKASGKILFLSSNVNVFKKYVITASTLFTVIQK